MACGGDDSGGGSGGAGGAGGATGGAGGATGGAAGASGGAAGSSSGGAAGGGTAGGAACVATTNQYANVDCKAACEHFDAWGSSGSCANPYAGSPDCGAACETVKNSSPYVNALFGCAGQNADCLGWKVCVKVVCG